MTAPQPPQKKLDSLTGVRFLAALLVFGYHGGHYANGAELDMFSSGMVGVSLFYVLSGFLMSWVAQPGDTARAFYQRRFARIYPSFVAAWLLSLAILVATGDFGPVDLLPPTLLQAWAPVEAVYFAGSAVFWSLSCEAFFYLVFPWLHKVISPLRTGALCAVGLGAVTLSVTAAFLALPFPENEFTRWLIIIFPPLRLLEFIAGAVVGMLFARGHRLRFPLWAAFAIALAAVWGSSVAPYSLSRYAVTLVPFIVLVASLASTDLRGGRSIFRWWPIVNLGVWSYTFYLLHAMVLGVMFAAFARVGLYDESTPPWLVLIEMGAALAGSICAAWLLHVAVERPLERRLRPARAQPRLDASVLHHRAKL